MNKSDEEDDMRYTLIVSLVVALSLLSCNGQESSETSEPDTDSSIGTSDPVGPPGPIIILQPASGSPSPTDPDTPVTWHRKDSAGNVTPATYSGSIFDTPECYLRHDMIGTKVKYLKYAPLNAATQSTTEVVMEIPNVRKVRVSWVKDQPLTWQFTKADGTSCTATSQELSNYDPFELPVEFDGFHVKEVISKGEMTEMVEADIEEIEEAEEAEGAEE